jgi:hypothetical protein
VATPTILNPLSSRLFSFTVFPNLQAREAKTYQLHWGEVCHFLTQDNTEATTKKELPLVVGGVFGTTPTDHGALRSDTNLKSLSIPLVDYDEGKISMEEAAAVFREAGIAAFVFPTPSWTKEKPKWRAALPLEKDITGDLETMKAAHSRIVNHVRSLGLNVSPESNTMSQSYYFGRLKTMPTVDWKTPVDGDFVDASIADDLSWATGKHRSVEHDPLKKIITTGGPGLHEALRTMSMKMIASGMDQEDARMLLEGWMRKWQCDDERWGERFREIGRLCRGAARRVAKNPTLRLREGDVGFDPTAPAPPLQILIRKPNRIPEYRCREDVLDGFIPAGLTVVGGTWGIGKTSNLLPLLANAAHLTPQEWGLWSTIRRKILWISESPTQAEMLLTALARLPNARPWEEFGEWFHIAASVKSPALHLAKGIRGIVDELSFPLPANPEFVVRPVVVLDTISANFELEDESSNAEVSKVMSTLKEQLPGAPVILVGHTPKALRRADFQSQTLRGAGAWEADAEATYFMFRDGEDGEGNRVFAIGKSRFTPTYHELVFPAHTEAVILPTPWLEPQHFVATLGIPTQSDRTMREGAAQVRRDEGRREALLSAVRSIIAQGSIPTRNTISESAGIPRGEIGGLLARSVEQGVLMQSAVVPAFRPNNAVRHGYHTPEHTPEWVETTP